MMNDKYPDAFCLKCQKHTKTNGKHTIVMHNSGKSRALTGLCPDCGFEVYKIMPQKKNPPKPISSTSHLSVIRSFEQNNLFSNTHLPEQEKNHWSIWLALTVTFLLGIALRHVVAL